MCTGVDYKCMYITLGNIHVFGVHHVCGSEEKYMCAMYMYFHVMYVVAVCVK